MAREKAMIVVSRAETATSTVRTIVPVEDSSDGADGRAESTGGDLGEGLAVEGGIDGADVGFADFVGVRMGPARPVRGHDGDEVGMGVGHDHLGVGLQGGGRVWCAGGLKDEGVGCDRRGHSLHALAGIVVGPVPGVHEGHRSHDRGERQNEQQIRHKESPGNAPASDHVLLSTGHPVTNMNATVIHVTPRLMMGITAERRRDILQGPRRFPEYL
jgi:hypothetical protein